jgi:hypothetical protein
MPLADPTTSTRQLKRGGGGGARQQQPCALLLCRAPPSPRRAALLQLHFAHSMTKMDDTHKNEQNSDYYAANSIQKPAAAAAV